MKLNKWLYGATALAMLAACSERDIAPGGDPEENKVSFTSAQSYLGISLELPTDPSTRAEGDEEEDRFDYTNDRFDDGDKVEYNVDKAALLLFAGTSEATAEFIGAYTLAADQAFDQPSNDNITVSLQKAVKLLETPTIDGEGNELWALAIVNYREGHFSITQDADDSSTYGDLTINLGTKGSVIPARIGNTDGNTPAKFNDIRGYITDCSFLNFVGEPTTTPSKNTNISSIFMTNAPLSKEKGTEVGATPAGNKIQTLAKLDKGKFKSSEIEAVNDPAGCIFVERAVAKVTCTEFPTAATLTHNNVSVSETGAISTTTETVSIPITSVEWMIDNEEQDSYIVRNAKNKGASDYLFWTYNYGADDDDYTGSAIYRFIGKEGMNDHNYDPNGVHTNPLPNTPDAHTWYRTYWCVDPNYGSPKVFNDQANGTYTTKYKNNTLTKDVKYKSSTPIYCHENTFDISHQNYKNTTRVIFKVQYNTSASGGVDLYAIKDELSGYYTRSDAQNLIARHVLASTRLNDIVKGLITSGTNSVNYNYNDFDWDFTYVGENKEGVDYSGHTKQGEFFLYQVRFKDSFYSKDGIGNKPTGQALTDLNKELDEIAASANEKNDIIKFVDNTCYYAVYLKHFGDTYCPLPNDWKGNDVTEVYGTDHNNYTGRYGLVRNNWYDLIINKITKLGKATVPDGNKTTSDDNKVDEYFLSARIHILSWARRTQQVDL